MNIPEFSIIIKNKEQYDLTKRVLALLGYNVAELPHKYDEYMYFVHTGVDSHKVMWCDNQPYYQQSTRPVIDTSWLFGLLSPAETITVGDVTFDKEEFEQATKHLVNLGVK